MDCEAFSDDRTTESTPQLTTHNTRPATQTSCLGETNRPVSLAEIKARILNVVKDNPEISQSQIAKDLNIGTDLVKYHMRDLKEKGLLKREGTTRKGKWVVTES